MALNKQVKVDPFGYSFVNSLCLFVGIVSGHASIALYDIMKFSL